MTYTYINSVKIVNEYDKFSVETAFNNPTRLWRYPIFTVSGSEAGLEKVYQSSVLMPNWEVSLNPTEKASFKMRIIVKDI